MINDQRISRSPLAVRPAKLLRERGADVIQEQLDIPTRISKISP
jgi:hypothetical protein